MLVEDDAAYSGDRDAALKNISWFSMTRVKSSRVLVVGAGAIGNEVIKNLALLGVGHIYVFDRDHIEMSNLSRSILYRERDAGQPKAAVAARAVAEINPTVKVAYKIGDLVSDLGEGFLLTMDVVIGCLDSIEARYLLNRLCFRAGVPWIDAGIGTLNGNVTVYVPPDGVCYECHFTDSHRIAVGAYPCNQLAREQAEQGRIPTTPTIASIMAAIQVQEFLKLLGKDDWKDRSLAGRRLLYSGEHMYAEISTLPSNPDCIYPHESIDIDRLELASGLSNSSLISDLWAIVANRFGNDSRLRLRRRFVLSLSCAECRKLTNINRVLDTLRDSYECGHCGTRSQTEADLNCVQTLTGRQACDLGFLPLHAFRIPPAGVLEIEDETGEPHYLQLDESPGFVAVHPDPDYVVHLTTTL